MLCNVHDTVGHGALILKGSDYVAGTVYGCLVAKCRGDVASRHRTSAAPLFPPLLSYATQSMPILDMWSQSRRVCWLRLYHRQRESDHGPHADWQVRPRGDGTSGASVVNTQAARGFIDANQFFGNTNNYSNISAGPDDVVLSSTPYVAQSTEGYDPVAALANTGWPLAAFPQALAGKTATQNRLRRREGCSYDHRHHGRMVGLDHRQQFQWWRVRFRHQRRRNELRQPSRSAGQWVGRNRNWHNHFRRCCCEMPFTALMIGNAIQIASGTGFTAGWYFVTGFTSATTVTLDRQPRHRNCCGVEARGRVRGPSDQSRL